MSLLAFGIGAVAVATLFPVAVLRSINATQLTRATLLRNNAEAMVDLYPNRLVHDPDRDFNPTVNGANDTGRQEHFNTNYIVDPWGWELIRQDNPAAANTFGQLQRYNGITNRLPLAGPTALSPAQLAFARNLVTLPDSWVPSVEGETGATAATATSATISGVSTADLAQVTFGGSPPSRITLLDTTDKFSITRIITNITGNTVSWNAPLPAQWFGANAIHTVASARIETQEFQFTWLLTVRNHGKDPTAALLPNDPYGDDTLQANVDVVVFFRRDFSLQSETVYPVTGTGPAVGRDYIVRLDQPVGANAQAGRSFAFLKKGAWLFDAINARWYRIQRVLNDNTNTPTVRIENAPPTGETLTRAILMPGVVQVYSLGTKQ